MWNSCQNKHVDILGRTHVGILGIATLGCSTMIAVQFFRIYLADIYRGAALDDGIRENEYQIELC